ncbi:MAG: hypothetical protein KIS92_01480 [Planctomycetota bacterium]|nr:hypothetical protein [Planctomycetota bacterium]
MRRMLITGLLAVLGAAACAQDYVWWEGESAREHNFNMKDFAAASLQRKSALSGENWLSTGGKCPAEGVFAKYEIEVPEDREYGFWVRKFWKHGPVTWRFDDGAWSTCGKDCALADSYELQKFLCANWVELGRVKLAKGKHRFELKLLAKEGEGVVACFDCFVLTSKPFTPAGKQKPGEKSGLAEPGWWAFEPEIDPLAPGALLDLRHLNEKTAGEAGFVKAQGNNFVLGSGKPVKFWAVNCTSTTVLQSREAVDYLCARLAKVGVNLVRFHQNVFDDRQPDPAKIDEKYLDGLFYFIAALKKQGIYTDLSFYYSRGFNPKKSHGIEGYEGLDNGDGAGGAYGVLFMSPRMQEIYRGWAKALLTTKNPYTGVPLAKEPAVAIVEVNNEDNLLFHTFAPDKMHESLIGPFEKRFGAWLAAKYGSLEKALAQWPSQKNKRDNAAEGRAELMNAWNMSSDGALKYGEDKKKRMQEQVEFLVEVQRKFFEDTHAYFKKDLGYGGLTIATGWTTADNRLLDALERYTYTACDVIDRHGYFGSGDVGADAAFQNKSALRDPASTPIPFVQEEGYPHTITEINWMKPNRYCAEMPLLCSTYGSLQGMDAYYFFCIGSSYWLNNISSNIPVIVPGVLGQFPAAALQYRRGDVAEGPVAVHQALTLADQFALKGCASLGHNDDQAARANATEAPSSLDPLASYVGRVTRTTAKDPGASSSLDLSKYIDHAKKIVKSATGEAMLDYGRGFFTVNTKRSQAAAGFLSDAGKIDLGDVVIEAKNEYGAIQVISLDGEPLAASKKILIQAFTEEKNYGFAYSEKKGPSRVTNPGTTPINLRKVDAAVTLKGFGGAATLTVLDANGYALRKEDLKSEGSALRIALPADALYSVVQR